MNEQDRCLPLPPFGKVLAFYLSLQVVYTIGKLQVCNLFFSLFFFNLAYCVLAFDKCFEFLFNQIYQPFSILLLDLEV